MKLSSTKNTRIWNSRLKKFITEPTDYENAKQIAKWQKDCVPILGTLNSEKEYTFEVPADSM